MTTTSRTRRFRAGILALMLVPTALVGACGNGSSSNGSSGSGGEPVGGQQQPQPPEQADKRVAWAPSFGPLDPFQPPGRRWYQWVQDKDCDGLLAQTRVEGSGASTVDIALYGGLAMACQGLWTEAKQALEVLDRDTLAPLPDAPAPDCLMASAYDTLERLVNAHEAEPNATIVIGGPAEPACSPPAEALAQSSS